MLRKVTLNWVAVVFAMHTMSSLFYPILLILLFNSLHSSSSLRIPKTKDNSLPIDTVFKLPSPSQRPKGGGFASGYIDIGGLELHQVSTFNKTWRTYGGGPDNLGATFFEPSYIPNGFFMLGSYGQPNNKALFGEVLVAKDLKNGALSQPIDYTLVWSSESSQVNKDGEGYIWLPIPPNGYKSVGYVVTTSSQKPPLDKTRCVRSDFTDTCDKNVAWIWGDDGINFYGIGQSNVQNSRLSVGTIKSKHNRGESVISCLKNSKNDVTNSMPDINQVNALIKSYSPWIYFHPDDEYRPSSVSWFFDNGALLYKKGDENNPVRIDPLGSILPQNGSNDGSYWLDLPNDGSRDQVKQGNLADAGAYLHIKPMMGGTYTDIAVWLFYPFNGNARFKYGFITLKLGKIGEHVGDWEHVTLRISNLDGQLKSVYFSQHGGGTWVNAPDIEYQDGKPVTYSSLHSHAFQPTTGTVLLGGIKGIGIRMDADKGGEVLDTGAKYVIVSGDYLGVVEPPWLNYAREWGPKTVNGLGEELEKIRKILPGPVKDKFDNVIKKVPAELLGQEGPTGPKWKSSWFGDEDTT